MENPRRVAWQAGFLYLLVAITGTFAFLVQERMISAGNARETAANILASGALFNLAIWVEIVMAICWFLAAYRLYVLFKPIRKNLAALMFSLAAAGAAVTCLVSLNRYAAWSILRGSGGMAAFDTDQVQALALLFLNLAKEGLLINHVFFGGWLFPLGYLVFKSGYFPKWVGLALGGMLVMGGTGYWVDFTASFLYPGYGLHLVHYTFFGELFLLLWLLIKKVKGVAVQAA